MSKEEINKNEIDEEKRQQIIAIMKALREKREDEIMEAELDINILDVKYYGAINWLDERNGENEEKQKDIFVIIEEQKGQVFYKYYDEELELIAAQREGDEKITPGKKFSDKKDKGFLEDIEKLEEKESLNKIEEEERLSEEEIEKDEITKLQKPQNVLQVIDVDRVYVNNRETFRKAYNIPHGVQKLAFRPTIKEDKKPLSPNITIDMLDKQGNIVEKVKEGDKEKTVNDFFEMDSATGRNPVNDDNTKFELTGHVERNKSQTMARFSSKNKPGLYVSIEQRETGGYNEIYAGEKTSDGNDPVETQLETDNIPIQTDLDMQTITSAYKGQYNKYNIDREADRTEEIEKRHGHYDDKKIPAKNTDGNEDTHESCDLDFIPGTDITWQEFANKCGYRGEGSIEKAQKKFIEYQNDNTQVNNKDLIEMIEDDLNNQMGNGVMERSFY